MVASSGTGSLGIGPRRCYPCGSMPTARGLAPPLPIVPLAGMGLNITWNSPAKFALIHGRGKGLWTCGAAPASLLDNLMDGKLTAVHEVAHRLAGWARPHRVHSPDGCSRS